MKRKAADEASRADACAKELGSASSEIAAFAPGFARLQQLVQGWHDDSAAALHLARQAAALSNEQLHAEGRADAVARYGPAAAQHLWPEPPSVCALIEQSGRTDAEAAFTVEVDAFATSVAEVKAARLVRLNAAKYAAPPQTDLVRELGRGLGLLTKAINEAKELDKPVRERLSLTTERIARYRASCAMRSIAAHARLAGPPPTRLGYEQVLDFYRLTDASAYSFGRVVEGAQFYTDIRRNVAILHATRGAENGNDVRARPGRVIVGGGPVGEGEGSDRDLGAQDGATKSAAAALDAEDAEDTEDVNLLFAEYAVSGVDAPGLNPSPPGVDGAEALLPRGPFTPIECADGLGATYASTARTAPTARTTRGFHSSDRLWSLRLSAVLGACVQVLARPRRRVQAGERPVRAQAGRARSGGRQPELPRPGHALVEEAAV